MLISGYWRLCDDGGVRPALLARVLAADGSWLEMFFLVDTGADRTVFSAGAMAELGLQPGETLGNLSGVGGNAAAVSVNTSIRLQKEDGILVGFHRRLYRFHRPRLPRHEYPWTQYP